jgi:hypothetical protein
MRSSCHLIVLGVLLISSAIAQDFKQFPGSHLDDAASREASKAAPGKESQVYTTSDSYDKVVAFYKGMYKQDTAMHTTGPKLPSGEQVQWAFFLIDGGKGLASSKYWMKVQHPYVGGADGKDIRDLTVIQTVRSK